MSSAKMTAEFVVDAIVGYGVLAKPHEAIALLKRYTAQVRSEAYEKAAYQLACVAFDIECAAIRVEAETGNTSIAETLRTKAQALRGALAQAPETKGGES
jgi:hypothetical protein